MTEITKQRWFMGKGRKINSIEETDSLPLGGTKISIIKVAFETDASDYYCVIEDESPIFRRNAAARKAAKRRTKQFSILLHG